MQGYCFFHPYHFTVAKWTCEANYNTAGLYLIYEMNLPILRIFSSPSSSNSSKFWKKKHGAMVCHGALEGCMRQCSVLCTPLFTRHRPPPRSDLRLFEGGQELPEARMRCHVLQGLLVIHERSSDEAATWRCSARKEVLIL